MVAQKVLFLNASNMEDFPVYPYAFIQVPAVARQSDIDVACRDLLGIPQELWAQTVSSLIEQQDPTMILITLRNTDSLVLADYEPGESKANNRRPYFPIERTRELITAIRGVSDLPIVVGGFGFSVIPTELMHYLRPDFGVVGDPNGFFEHFEDIQVGNLERAPNLLYFQDTQLIANRRVFYPPLAQTEYTPQVIEQMMTFYEAFSSPGFQGAPIEIMRGCRHGCVFCSEPHVKGKQVRYRDPDTIMKEIKTLVEHGVTQLYIISSELNPEDNAFVLELADRIWIFNEQQPEDQKVTWFGANYLLKFSQNDYKRLDRSGFTGGWFDITALDDQNARAMGTPYRNQQLRTHLKIYAHFKRQQVNQTTGKANSVNDMPIGWTMFLGNPATTVETIRTTLQFANRNGIAQLFDQCEINTNIRVFDYEEPDQPTLGVTHSITMAMTRTGYWQALPSFAYPPALLQDLGSEKEIAEVFKHIGETYLSTKYQKTRNWLHFIRQETSSAEIINWITELSDSKGAHLPVQLKLTDYGKPSAALQQLFSKEEPPEQKKQAYENLAKEIVDWLLSTCIDAFPNFWEPLDFPGMKGKPKKMTSYELAISIFNRWSTEQELINAIAEPTRSILSEAMQIYIHFCIRAMLYRFNVLVNPKYKRLFVSTD